MENDQCLGEGFTGKGFKNHRKYAGAPLPRSQGFSHRLMIDVTSAALQTTKEAEGISVREIVLEQDVQADPQNLDTPHSTTASCGPTTPLFSSPSFSHWPNSAAPLEVAMTPAPDHAEEPLPKGARGGVKRSESDAEIGVDEAIDKYARCPEKSPMKRTKGVFGMSLNCWLPFKESVAEAGAFGLRQEQSADGGNGERIGESQNCVGHSGNWTSMHRGDEAMHDSNCLEEPGSPGVVAPSFGAGSEVCMSLSKRLVVTLPDAPGVAPLNLEQMPEYSPPVGPRLTPLAIPSSPVAVPPSPSPRQRVSNFRDGCGRAGGPLTPGAKNRQAEGLRKAQGLLGEEGLQGLSAGAKRVSRELASGLQDVAGTVAGSDIQGGLQSGGGLFDHEPEGFQEGLNGGLQPGKQRQNQVWQGVMLPRKPPRAKPWAAQGLQGNGGDSGNVRAVRKRRGFGTLLLPAGVEDAMPGLFSPSENASDREAVIRSHVRKLTTEEKTARLSLYARWKPAEGARSPQRETGDVIADVAGLDDISEHLSEASSGSSSSFRIRTSARLYRNVSDARTSFATFAGVPAGGPMLLSLTSQDSMGASEGSKQSHDGAVVAAFGRGDVWESPETPLLETIEDEGEQECPEAPTGRSKMSRQGSLMETKLLLTTALKRTHSFFLFDKHFEFLRVVGRGSSSTVYQARDRRNGGLCAVKKSKREFKSRGDRERYLHEVQSVACLSEHPHVVKYYRGWQQEGHFYIQMELCEGGNLKDWTDKQSGPLEEERIWSWVRQIASGLQYLHSKSVLHLDIKPENIFLDAHGTLKIGDFGLAVLRRQWEWEEGDGAYVAPELLQEHEPGPEADMYSFGAMIFEWATGRQLPRSGPERAGHVDLPASRSDALHRLVRMLLTGRPEERLSAEEVLAMAQ